MSIRLVAADVDPERGVMSRLDYITYADTSDCLVLFFHPYTVAHVRYDLAVFVCFTMYDTIERPLLPYLVRYQSRSHAYYDT